jgi:DNA-binding NtrC family response regulator
MGSKSQSIIAVDSDPRSLDRIRIVLDSTHVVLTTGDPKRAMAWLQNDTTISAIVVDQALPNGASLELLRRAQELRPNARRILIASYSDLAQIVEGLHSGAVQRTISKPINAQELINLVRLPLSAARPGGNSQTAVA